MEYWRSSEWKLGLFIACGIVLFSALIFTISNLEFFNKGYKVRVLFKFANGVEEGAPARLAGVKVGEVKKVKIIYDYKDESPIVEVDLNIQKDVRIKQDASVLVSTLGLLGEKYIEILPGTKEKPLLKDGDVIIGYNSVPLAKLSDLGYQIALKLDRTIDALQNMFVKEEQRENIEVTLHNIRDLSSNLNSLVLDTDETVKKINSGEGTLGRLINEVKRNPWKLLHRPRRSELKKLNKEGNRGYLYSK